MADAENVIPSSKKRAAGREISKDNPGLDDDDENASDQELGTFKKASDEVLASRRIVKARRQTPSSRPPSSNPFAGIRLVPPNAASDTPIAAAAVPEAVKGTEVGEDKVQCVVVEQVEKEFGDNSQNNDTKEENDLEKLGIESLCDNESSVAESDNKETLQQNNSGTAVEVEGIKSDIDVNKVEESGDANKAEEGDKSKIVDVKDGTKISENSSGVASKLNPFQQLSGNKNAFTGFTGTGFLGSAFSFNPISNDGIGAGTDFVPSIGQKTDQPLFSFGSSVNNGNGSLFGAKDNSVSKSGGLSLQEVPTETGEENETAVFTANSALFEYIDGGWKERGRGEVKVNISMLEGPKARLVMRTKGNYRLILNASLYPEMKLTYMDKKGITFACINSNGEGNGSLSTYALKFRDGPVADEFHAVVESHKGAITAVLKTPENSPQ